MRILAIDTATEACSVALWNDGTHSAHFELCPREHTQRILPMVQDILAANGTSLTELNALAYGRGPGSFTGVRIGIGIAQGLALGADLPMIGVSTLATMAQGACRNTGVSGAIDVVIVMTQPALVSRNCGLGCNKIHSRVNFVNKYHDRS